jgi:hypothetical protein
MKKWWSIVPGTGFVSDWVTKATSYIYDSTVNGVEPEVAYKELTDQLMKLLEDVSVHVLDGANKLVAADLKALDLRGKVLLVKHSDLTMEDISSIKKGIEGSGAVGILGLPHDIDVTVEAIDTCISSLEMLKARKFSDFN